MTCAQRSYHMFGYVMGTQRPHSSSLSLLLARGETLGEEPDHLEPQSSDVRNGDNYCHCLVGWVLQEVKEMILSTAIETKEKLYSLQ